jgi:hypothetical protein
MTVVPRECAMMSTVDAPVRDLTSAMNVSRPATAWSLVATLVSYS